MNKVDLNSDQLKLVSEACDKFPSLEDFDKLQHMLLDHFDTVFNKEYELYEAASNIASDRLTPKEIKEEFLTNNKNEIKINNKVSIDIANMQFKKQTHSAAWRESCHKVYHFYDADLILKYDEKNKKVSIMPNISNYSVILKKLYPNLRFSIFERKTYLGNEPMSEDLILKIMKALTNVLGGLNVKKNEVEQAIRLTAKENEFNPLKEYFEGLKKPTGKNYLDNYLFDVCKAEKNEINRIIGRKWMISAVARALKPGCYVEGALIFSGKQGAGKSFFFQNINPKKEYYCGSNVDISNIQKAAQTFMGKFVIEFNELASISKKDLEDVKAYLTTQVDTFVPKYENESVSFPRMLVYGGSTNDSGILYDTTGNRRFWCIECLENFDRDMLIRIKDELWSEAYQAFLGNPNEEAWTLNEEEKAMLEEANAKFQADDPLAAHMQEKLACYPDERLGVNTINSIAKEYTSNVHPNTVRKIMTDVLGWKKGQFTAGENKGNKCYIRPKSVNVAEENHGWN